VRLAFSPASLLDLNGHVADLEVTRDEIVHCGQHAVVRARVDKDYVRAHRVHAGCQRPDMEVMNVADAGQCADRSAQSGDIDI
jgi:hypothetical protein